MIRLSSWGFERVTTEAMWKMNGRRSWETSVEEAVAMTRARDGERLKTQPCRYIRTCWERQNSQLWAVREGGKDPRITWRFLGWALRLGCHSQKQEIHNMKSQTWKEAYLGQMEVFRKQE